MRLAEIHVATPVFQWRLEDEDLLADERHVWDLVSALELKDPPEPLDPILVTAIGQRFFVVDGHHRVDAYLTFGYRSVTALSLG